MRQYYTKTGDPSPYTLEQWSKANHDRDRIISENRSRRVRKHPEPPLPVPAKLAPPFIAICYELEPDGLRWRGVLDSVDDFEAEVKDYDVNYDPIIIRYVLKFEPAVR